MKKQFTIYNLQLIILFLFLNCFYACKKEESNNNTSPVIELKTAGIYISADTAIAEGSQITIGIKASANGGENLCNLIVLSNHTQSLLDYGFNASSIDKDLIIHKNADSIQRISVIIRNKKGLCDSLHIILRRNGSAYKAILYFPHITLGGQSNTTTGSFASLTKGQVFSLTDASQNQSMIDLLYYYSATNLEYNCLSSAGGNVTGIYSGSNAPENWVVKNTTYFSRSVINIPLSAFDAAQNDSLIIACIFSNGGRKAKALVNNQIWGFQTYTGKYGLIKIIDVSGQENGTVTFTVKLQE